MKSRLKCSDNLKYLKTLPDNSIDSMVTDPPAGISFMQSKGGWDDNKGGRDRWIAWLQGVMVECNRVIKPGGYALVWALPRTSHWTMTALENAGWEIRDVVHHVFGSGFPKSLNISIAIDKQLGKQRHRGKAVGMAATAKMHEDTPGAQQNIEKPQSMPPHQPKTPQSKQWSGWGTALKPAVEEWILVRKPLSEPTVAKNVLKHGTGGLNIDKSRVGCSDKTPFHKGDYGKSNFRSSKRTDDTNKEGRFPANLILECTCKTPPSIKYTAKNDTEVGKSLDTKDMGWGFKKVPRTNISDEVSHKHETNCPCRTLDDQSGVTSQGHWAKSKVTGYGKNVEYKGVGTKDKEKGGASRYFAQIEDNVDKAAPFFYCPKVAAKERNMGDAKNTHPTVKPTKLLKYLIKLITPPQGVVLDPFAGSGSTLIAAKQEGFKYVGIELDKKYIKIARKRLKAVK